MVVTVLADNQERAAASLAANGAAVNLGWFHEWQPKRAACVIEELLADKNKRQKLADNALRLVDTNGVKRTIIKMLKIVYKKNGE
jgi:spore coat polysaccharide biosynthesis predicted glycosyltransferase SpsG